LTGTLTRVTSLRTVGLCHGVFANYRMLQKLLDVEEQDLAIRFGGVNHFFWILDFAVRGEPGYPLLAERLGEKTLDEALSEGETDEMGFHSHHALCDTLYRSYGYLPYVGDRHTSEFLPGYLTPNLEALERFRLVRTSVEERVQKREQARQVARDLAEGKKAPFARSRETAVDIMVAIAHDKPFCDVVNLPNVGQIDNLPRGAVVETLGLVDSLGFRPISTGPLPPALQVLVAPHCHCQQMTLEAALTGDRELALQALLLDPICAHLSPPDIRAMGEELLAATRAWLPQFN
jgi:alpha-galactosidase